MATADYASAARALATNVDSDEEQDTILPIHHAQHSPTTPWTRRSRNSTRLSQGDRPRTITERYVQQAWRLQNRAVKLWNQLTLVQRAGLLLVGAVLAILLLLLLVYHNTIFAWLGGVAKQWREMPAGWLIIWVLTFIVSFPPLFGYSTLVTIAGFVYGMKGWLIIASATVIGSTCALVVSRTFLIDFVSQMTAKNKQFAALSLVLKHDGLKLLCLIRLCPLPFSLANGAISTIPTVTWPNFMLATAIASPKLLLHIFVGSKLGELAEEGDKMDMKTRIISYISVVVGVSLGIGTGYLVYVRTAARAKQLEAEEAAAVAAGDPRLGDLDDDYADDPDTREAVNILRRDDDISLHQTYDDEHPERTYRDEFTDDEDARERDVFDIGEDEADEENDSTKESRR